MTSRSSDARFFACCAGIIVGFFGLYFLVFPDELGRRLGQGLKGAREFLVGMLLLGGVVGVVSLTKGKAIQRLRCRSIGQRVFAGIDALAVKLANDANVFLQMQSESIWAGENIKATRTYSFRTVAFGLWVFPDWTVTVMWRNAGDNVNTVREKVPIALDYSLPAFVADELRRLVEWEAAHQTRASKMR